jgi:signal transduction histidine kinase
MVPSSSVTATRHHAFIATLAHELRQPLSVLTSGIDVVSIAPSSAAAALAIASMQRQAVQMKQMIDDLLDEARWAAGTVTLRPQCLNVCQLAREAAEDSRSAVTTRGLTMEIDVPDSPLWANADPVRLHQALSNLLGNAVKFTEPGGAISLSARHTALGVAIHVRDTGHGIEPAALSSVFDLFSQVHAGAHAGLGIGLSVVREIMTLHRGFVEARSAGAGRGAEFILTLPAAIAAVRPMTRYPAPPALVSRPELRHAV